MHEVLATLGPVPEDGQLLGTDDKTTEFSLHLTNKWELNMSDESNIQVSNGSNDCRSSSTE